MFVDEMKQIAIVIHYFNILFYFLTFFTYIYNNFFKFPKIYEIYKYIIKLKIQ